MVYVDLSQCNTNDLQGSISSWIKGVSYQFVYSLALVYMAIPTFVYMVFYAKKRYQARTEKINNTSER